MKKAFVYTFIGLILLSVIAWILWDGRDPDALVWSTDVHPTRDVQVALFEKMNPGIKVAIDPTQQDLMKTIVQCTGGVGPDLFSANLGAHLSSYVKAGVALDITDYLKEWGIDFDNDIWKGVYNTCAYEGRIYGIPNNAAVDGLWYNKDIFDAAGLKYPSGDWTWDDFLKIAPKLVQRDDEGKITQFAIGINWKIHWQQFVAQWGGNIYSKDGTKCTLDSPEVIAAIQFMYDLVYKYRVAPTALEEAGMVSTGGWGGRDTRTFFCSGRYATALGGRWWLLALRDYPDLKYDFTESPHGKYKVFYSYGKSTIINSNSKHINEALCFLKFLLSPEYNELLNVQGDAVGPMIEYCKLTPKQADNPFLQDMPRWNEIMKYGIPEEVSPFVNGTIAMRIIEKQIEQVRRNLKTPEKAMEDATRLVNVEIKKTLKYDYILRERYEKLTGGKVR